MGRRKRKEPEAPAAALPPLPDLPPLPGMPLPPAVDLPAPPMPTEMPSPAPLPEPSLAPSVAEPAVAASAPTSTTEEPSYGDIWAKRTEKPLQQVYGHIDRLSNRDAGSLLDRYADRFGHDLDREIVVLRKQMHDERLAEAREAPTVELLDAEPVVPEGDRLSVVEARLRELKPQYETAKQNGDEAALTLLRPELKALMEERKALKGASVAPSPQVSTTAAAASDSDEFPAFVAVVDALLGSDLPEAAVNAFIASPDFAIYQEVGSNPSGATDVQRAQFFVVVDALLGGMPDEAVQTFIAGPDFALYGRIGARYS